MIPKALTIAGSDSGGCAGIQADLKTFGALGVHGMSAITAVTAQNTVEVTDIFTIPAAMVRAQIEAVSSDIGVDAAKTGMLASPEGIQAVAEAVFRHSLNRLVVDPVMVATSGARLVEERAVAALIDRLIPLAEVVTPNIPEAEVLTGLRLVTEDDVWEAAGRLLSCGPRAVVIKGGHLSDSDLSVDYLLDEAGPLRLEGPRIKTANTHGSGCTFAAAITALLARGLEHREACHRAKEYVTEALRHSLSMGRGHGPLGHFWRWWTSDGSD